MLKYPRRWLRDPDFWKPIAQNLIQWSVLGIIGFVVAYIAGFVSDDTAIKVLILIVVGVLSAYLTFKVYDWIKNMWGIKALVIALFAYMIIGIPVFVYFLTKADWSSL